MIKGTPDDTAFAQAFRKAHVDLRITFGNGCHWHEKGSPEAALSIRLLHAYFSCQAVHAFFYKELKLFLGEDQAEKLTIYDAMQLIRADMIKRGEIDAKDMLVMVLAIDEIDKVLVDGPDVERRRNLTPMIRALGSAMCGAESKVDSSVFLCPLIAGVVVGDIHEVISKSSHPIMQLLPTPLNAPEVVSILRSRRWAPEVMRDPDLHRCLGDLGGVPLVLEKFVETLEVRYPDVCERGSGIAYGTIREETKAFMIRSIMPRLSEKANTLKELLFAVLWNRKRYNLSSTFGSLSLESLQATGFLTLDEKGRILIPIIYLVREDNIV